MSNLIKKIFIKDSTNGLNVADFTAIVMGVTASYKNGTSWCRIWTNGFCEQGGIVTTTSIGNFPVQFVQPFADTNYTFVATPRVNTGIITEVSRTSDSITLSNISPSGDNIQMNANWVAYGYINDPLDLDWSTSGIDIDEAVQSVINNYGGATN